MRTNPELLDPKLLKIMQGVYDNYTGQEIAATIAYIRGEIEHAKEQARLAQEIAVLESKLDENQ